MNKSEEKFDREYGVFDKKRRGYPDRLIRRPDGVWIGIEIKRSAYDVPKKEQLEMLETLHEQGVPCYIYWASTGACIRIDEYKKHFLLGVDRYLPILDARGTPIDRYAGWNSADELFFDDEAYFRGVLFKETKEE